MTGIDAGDRRFYPGNMKLTLSVKFDTIEPGFDSIFRLMNRMPVRSNDVKYFMKEFINSMQINDAIYSCNEEANK